jgi:glutathione-specific gamma-glutamylcyclotransferase
MFVLPSCDDVKLVPTRPRASEGAGLCTSHGTSLLLGETELQKVRQHDGLNLLVFSPRPALPQCVTVVFLQQWARLDHVGAHRNATSDTLSGMWVFGYGSLMWRVGFPFEARRPGYINGYRRRFWQGSSDHRGVPGAPGRVVTLLGAEPETRCWGMAYRVADDHVDDVVARLDHREKGGYERVAVPVYDATASPFAEGVAYIATPSNPAYLGCAPLPAIAEQVVASSGPSGDNSEYVLELADALRAIGADDGHVFRLERLVRERLDPCLTAPPFTDRR